MLFLDERSLRDDNAQEYPRTRSGHFAGYRHNVDASRYGTPLLFVVILMILDDSNGLLARQIDHAITISTISENNFAFLHFNKKRKNC